MNKNLIANVDNKNIYLITDKNISFYICVPNVKRANIVLNLLSNTNNINMNITNISDLTNEVVNIYSKFHFNDIALVTPVLDSNLLEQIKLNNDEKIFAYTDKVMGYLINASYGILTSSNIEVEKQIKFNNNLDFQQFNDWFVKKYNGRVELVNYNTAPINKFDNEATSKPDNSADAKLASDVLDNTASMQTLDSDSNSTTTKEPGFVSYVLLGVIVAVISLVILYKLL